MEAQFEDELRLLANALKQEAFRFILIGHNRYSLYKDIADWLSDTFAKERPLLELRLRGKDYRQIADEIISFRKGILLIPDFDWLLQGGNETVSVAFNQRRDAFAQLDIAFVCFIEPASYRKLPEKVPDWWSLRSLELDFHRVTVETANEFSKLSLEGSSLGGDSKREKEAEIDRLTQQLEAFDPSNKPLRQSLYSQLGSLSFDLSEYEKAQSYFEKSLGIAQQIGDKSGEGATLNNISQIYQARGDYETALNYLQQSLSIRQQIGDKSGEGATLNNISQIYQARGDYETALSYLQQSLGIQQQIGDKKGEGVTLNNISQIYDARGDYETALNYLQQSLSIRQQIGDKSGEGATLNNISQIYDARGDYEMALTYLQQSLSIQQQIGDKSGEGRTLNNISQIYDARGDYETALSYLQQSLGIQQQIGDKKGEGTTLNNISQIYKAQSDYETALTYLQQSLSIQQQIGDKAGLAVTYHNMGAIYWEQFQDAEKAIAQLWLAYLTFKQLGSPKVEVTADYLEAIKSQLGEVRYQEILQSIQDEEPIL